MQPKRRRNVQKWVLLLTTEECSQNFATVFEMSPYTVGMCNKYVINEISSLGMNIYIWNFEQMLIANQ